MSPQTSDYSPTPYRTLNDAAPLCAGLAPGATRVLYRRRDGSFAELGSVACSDLEELFVLLQGELWSPRGEARGLVTSCGSGHTSMSVGEQVLLPDGRVPETAPVSFREVASGARRGLCPELEASIGEEDKLPG